MSGFLLALHWQNKEPLHMLRLFQGKFVVHEGGNPSSFKNVTEEAHVSDGTGLYHIRGSNEYNTRAVQVCELGGAQCAEPVRLDEPKAGCGLISSCGRRCCVAAWP